MDDKVRVVEGEVYRDERGVITSLNDFHLEGANRIYFIHHPDTAVVRGWHGHRWERKWFYCVKGTFDLAVVKIDDWFNPSADLVPEVFHLTEERSRIVCVPPGYANCLRTETADSTMMVLSGVVLPDAYADSWRYPAEMWIDWARKDIDEKK